MHYILEVLLQYVSVPIPYTVIVFYAGFIFGVILDTLNFNFVYDIESPALGSAIIVYGFLPALLFNETMNLKWFGNIC